MTASEIKPKAVAIVAVHGVGDQQPEATARAVADVLLRFGATQPVSDGYSEFKEQHLRIPVNKAYVAPPCLALQSRTATHVGDASAASPLEERSPLVRSLQARRPKRRSAGQIQLVADQGEYDISFEFMREQLEKHVLSDLDAVYGTLRLEGTRTFADGRPPIDVHIYELYWADLSRLGRGITKFLGEFYQTVFHLCQIGRQTIDLALAEHATDPKSRSWWASFSFFDRWAVRALTLAMPILNLFLVVILLLLPLAALPVGAVKLLAVIIPLAALVTLTARFLTRDKVSYGVWIASPFVVTLAVGVVLASYFDSFSAKWGFGAYHLLLCESAGLMVVPLGIIIRSYESRRPGAIVVARMVALLLSVTLAIALSQSHNSAFGFLFTLLRAAEVLFLCLALSWGGLLACSTLAAPLGWTAAWRSSWPARPVLADTSGQARAWRAVNTGLLSLSLPGAIFLLVTLILYSALGQVISNSLPPSIVYQPTEALAKILALPGTIRPGDLFEHLLGASGTTVFVVFLYCLVMSVLTGVWCLFPAVWADVFPPRGDANAVALGNWLTRGYRALSIAAMLLFIGMPMALGFGMFADWWGPPLNEILEPLGAGRLLARIGALIVGTAGGLLVFHGRLQNLALGFRPALDIVLEIDNYLREFPRDATPRARICARYSSLLRYLCRWTNPADPSRSYDAIIVVSHSQGTVISADLLRFLTKEHDPELARLAPNFVGHEGDVPSGRLPVVLVTLGCPLRQLYGWRFPHLYRWAYNGNWPVAVPANAAQLAEDSLPDPDALGVDLWLNAYRSGDYIGRSLWRADDDDQVWSPTVVSDRARRRRECCLGAGAHTHYLDSHSAIIKEMDDLIVNGGQA